MLQSCCPCTWDTPSTQHLLHSFGIILMSPSYLMTKKSRSNFFIIVVYLSQSVQLFGHVRLFVTPWTAAWQVSLSITNSRSLLKLTSIVLMMPSNHLIVCHPLFLPPSVFPSIRVFSNESSVWDWFSFSRPRVELDWLCILLGINDLAFFLLTPIFWL